MKIYICLFGFAFLLASVDGGVGRNGLGLRDQFYDNDEIMNDGPVIQCDNYNEKPNLSEGPCSAEDLDQNGFCNRTQICRPGSYCFMSWRNDSGVIKILNSGCWLKHHECVERFECRASNDSHRNGVYYCCCEGSFCHRKFYLDPAADPAIEDTAQSKEVASQNSVLTFSDASGNLDSRATFLEARKACENNGMRLARVDEKKEYETLKQKLRGNPEVKYWIETEFADCVYMSYINSLKASDCMDLKLPFICEEISPWAVTLSSESAELQEEENLKIDCTAKGFPLPVVSWYKDEELLTNDSNERVHQSIESASSTLVINNSHLTDAGRYRCFATNAAINFELNVLAFVDLKVNPKGVEFQKVEEKTPDFFAEVQKLKEKKKQTSEV